MNIKTFLQAPVPRWVALVAMGGVSVTSIIMTERLTRKRLEGEYQKRLIEEIENTKKFYTTLGKVVYDSPQDALVAIRGEEAAVVNILEGLGYTESVDDETVESDDGLIEVVKNVFTDAAEGTFDFDEELAKRGPDKPYILEHDEFYNTELTTSSLTFYEGDGVLADERDEHIPDIDAVVGEDNLLKFGHGSRDNNVLYVRNERLEVDFEIVRNDGKYTEIVLGYIQHEDSHRPRKFRTYDE